MKHYLARQHRVSIDFGACGVTPKITYALKLACRHAIEETLDHEQFNKDAEVSVTFCDNEQIRELNRTYRDKDRATDVLSFPQYEPFEAARETDEPVTLGDIVISLERAAEQAKEVGHPFLDEVAFLCIHSTLHLLGYDHERSTEDEEDMCRRQRQIVAALEQKYTTKECNS